MPDETTQGQDQGGQQPASSPMYPTGRLISTIKDDVDSSFTSTTTQDSQPAGDKTGTDPGTAKNIQDESGKAKGGEGDKGTPATTETKPKADDSSEERFDKNPMFQRLNGANQKLRDELREMRGALEAVMKMKGGKEGPADADPDNVNILEMEDGDLREQFDTNPKKFLADYGRQLFREFREQFDEGKKTVDFQTSQRKELETYATENTDFIEMWENGKIPEYMRAHPGNTAMSAHAKLTEPTRTQARIDAAVKEAVQKARDEERRNAGARLQGATVLPTTSGAPRGGTDAADAILKDTSKSGGRTNAILKAMGWT